MPKNKRSSTATAARASSTSKKARKNAREDSPATICSRLEGEDRQLKTLIKEAVHEEFQAELQARLPSNGTTRKSHTSNGDLAVTSEGKRQRAVQARREKRPNPNEEFVINVHTGKYKSFVDQAKLSVVLHDKNGNTSKQITVFMENGSTHEIVVPEDKLGAIERDARIAKVELRPGFDTHCYVRRIEVKNQETTSNIGVFCMLKCGNLHCVSDHTSLPQKDDPRAQEDRKQTLEKMREEYKYTELQQGLPAEVACLPFREVFSVWNAEYVADLVPKIIGIAFSEMLDKMKHVKLTTIQDLKKLYSCAFNEPEGLRRWSFTSDHENDLVFANQRTNGLNPSVIKLCTDHVRVHGKIPVTDEMLEHFLEGLTIKQAIDKKRLFVCDLEILKDLHPVKQDFELCAPVGLFFLNKDGMLTPVAIQLYQDPAKDNPVFLPSDEWTWTLAKMWFNNADAAYHQSITHLGFTHLLMEGVAVATHRQLSVFHPIYKMLAPHFLFLIEINYLARLKLISKDGIVDRIMNSGIEGAFKLIEKRLTKWRMDVDGTLPEELKQRQVEDPKTLPNYYFRDDALRVYDAIKTYVTQYVTLYYGNTSDLQGDYEIQAWAKELTSERGKGGCGLQGVPGNGQLKSVDDLIAILTSIIYTCSVGHAAANFAQYDEYGFPPGYPGLLMGQPPRDKKKRSEDDIVQALANVDSILETMLVTKLLSTKETKSLGDFEEVPTITDPKAFPVVDRFRKKLAEISKEIKEDNEKRTYKYTHVDPQFVPNAISI